MLPFTPVPVTFQTLFVILSGLVLGPRLGPLSQSVYLLMGLAGLPVFSQMSGGPGAFLGPTGGFLLSFVPASWLCGIIAERTREPGMMRYCVAAYAGLVVIYVSGALWLALYLTSGAWAALCTGVLPFLPVDLVKASIAATVALRLRKALARQSGTAKEPA
jgi:biotin transport system substrate-specific component